MSKQTADFLVIGGGVIGVNLALCAKRTFPESRVVLIDKEADCGLHASGRNSGVLHAGFYYTADSLKSRFTRDGNRIMVEYCKERGLLLNQCGKLVVAKNAAELEQMDELLRRAAANGVELHELSEQEAREIEPSVRTFGKCLFSPATASVNPREVMSAFVQDARNAGVELRLASEYRGHQDKQVRIGDDTISAGYVINAAGLYADRIAQDYGFSSQYRIIPFKGLYLYGNPGAVGVRTNVYPVPDLANPFLGVHFTVSAEGRTKLGPTAIPAFWREHYKGFANFNLYELAEIVVRELALFAADSFGFRSLALQEMTKYSRRNMVRLASELVSGISVSQFEHWGPAGIRAQLVDTKQKKLVMDFCYEGDDRSFHVLNAVSPAFTCAIPFTRYLFGEIQSLLH
jgi:(S)-2-hydroxyglutarate dehydrogenase